MTVGTITIIRRLLLALVLLAIMATTAELLLLGHYEDNAQWIPLALNAIAVPVFGWHLVRSNRASVRSIQVVMLGFVVAGLVGIYLHYQGNLQFQLEIDPSTDGWELFKKVVQAKAPPALAPAAMAQSGLLGLILTYRHPALDRDSSPGIPKAEG